MLGRSSRWSSILSASPKPHLLNPTPATSHKRKAKTEVALQFSESCAAEVALATFAFLQCGCHFYKKLSCNKQKDCTATLEKLLCRKVALSCRFQAPTFRHPRLGPAYSPKMIGYRSWLPMLKAIRSLIATLSNTPMLDNIACSIFN